MTPDFEDVVHATQSAVAAEARAVAAQTALAAAEGARDEIAARVMDLTGRRAAVVLRRQEGRFEDDDGERLALLEGRPTVELRCEMARLEQDQRREATERDAAERQARAAAEAEELVRQEAAVAALVRGIEGRVRERVAGLDAPAAPALRRTPVGIHIARAEEIDE